MKKWLLVAFPLTIVLTAAVTWSASQYVFERPVFDASVQQKTISSASLGETRDYLVHVPSSYGHAPNQRYPVIYVLDGSSQDVHTAASAALMARIGVTEEFIVVGIPNIDGQGRSRDYVPPGMRQDTNEQDSPEGRADKFLEFLRGELIPEIDKRYRTSSTRVLAGNSLGGLFVVYALTTEPALFEAYFANSPSLWRDNEKMVGAFDSFLQRNPSLTHSLFLSLGSEENDKMKSAFQHTIVALQNHAPATLRWRAYWTLGATHRDNAVLATPVALRWAFDTTWIPTDTASGGDRHLLDVTGWQGVEVITPRTLADREHGCFRSLYDSRADIAYLPSHAPC